MAATRYVELNPVRAHRRGRDDALADVAPFLDMLGDWRAFLATAGGEEDLEAIRRHGRTGQPLGDDRRHFGRKPP